MQSVKPIVQAEILSSEQDVLLQITLVNGETIIGYSWGIEHEYDEDGNDVGYDVLAFDSISPKSYFRLSNSDIKEVKLAP